MTGPENIAPGFSAGQIRSAALYDRSMKLSSLATAARDDISLGWSSFRRLLGITWSHRGLRALIIVLLAIDLGWVAFFCVAKGLYNTDVHYGLYEMRELRITEEGGHPESYNHVKTALVVLLLAFLAVEKRQIVYLAFALVFGVVLRDDWLALHETWGEYFVDTFRIPAMLGVRDQDIGELITWALLGLLIVPTIVVGLARSDRRHLGVGLAFLIPFGMLLFCGIIVDQGYHTLWDAFPGAGILLDSIEDGGEMVAMTLTCALALGAVREARAGL